MVIDPNQEVHILRNGLDLLAGWMMMLRVKPTNNSLTNAASVIIALLGCRAWVRAPLHTCSLLLRVYFLSQLYRMWTTTSAFAAGSWFSCHWFSRWLRCLSPYGCALRSASGWSISLFFPSKWFRHNLDYRINPTQNWECRILYWLTCRFILILIGRHNFVNPETT